jgi:argininosuccinate lyase
MGDRIINTGEYNEFGQVNTQYFVQGDFITIEGNSIKIDMSQDLTQAAVQIQDLIEQLQKRGVTTKVAHKQVAENIATQAKKNPALKDKLRNWGQSLADATVSDVVKGVVKLAIHSATGIPLP